MYAIRSYYGNSNVRPGTAISGRRTWGWRFEVVDMDGRKIDKLLVSREEAEDAED